MTHDTVAPPPLYADDESYEYNPYEANPEGMLVRQMLNTLLSGGLAPKPEEAGHFGYRRDAYPLPNDQDLAYVEVFLTVPGTREHVKVSGLWNGSNNIPFDDSITVTLWGKDSTETQARQDGDTMTLDRYGDAVVPFDNNFSADEWMAYDAHIREFRPKVIMAFNGLVAS